MILETVDFSILIKNFNSIYFFNFAFKSDYFERYYI